MSEETIATAGLREVLDRARSQLTPRAVGAVDGLRTLATTLEMKETAARLGQVRQRFDSDTFSIIILGRFKNGKSTLLNALLGRPTQDVPELASAKGPMPIDDLPCTACLTSIRFSDRPYVRIWRFDGKSEDWSLARYLRESTIHDDEEENVKVFSNIRQFEVGFPAELCKSGVTLLDSPGLDDVPARTEVTRQAVGGCDAAIAVYSSRAIMAQSELQFISEVAGTGTRVFTIINTFDGREVDERFKRVCWNRLVKEWQDGPPYEGQDLASRDMYFVDARLALEGKMNGDAKKLEDSGMALFERRLGDFLVKDRQHAHLGKWAKSADGIAEAIEQQLSQRRAALTADHQKLMAAYEAIQPQLAAIRAKREKVPAIFARYRKEVERELKASFEVLITRLRQDLPEELKAFELPSLKGFHGRALATFHTKKLVQEALDFSNDRVSHSLTEWGNNEARKVLEPILERMVSEIEDEVAQIEREYEDIHLQLTGWRPATMAGEGVISNRERAISAGIGLLLLDPASMLGASGGFRGVAANFAGQIAAAVVLGALGLAGSVVLIPVMIAVGIAAGIGVANFGLDERVKKKAWEQIDAGLKKAPSEAGPLVDQEVARTFDDVQNDTMQRLLSAIEAEERTINEVVELNKRGQAEKERSQAALDAATRQVAQHRQSLKEVMATLKQTG